MKPSHHRRIEATMRGCTVRVGSGTRVLLRGSVSSRPSARGWRRANGFPFGTSRETNHHICRSSPGQGAGSIRYVNEEELEVEIVNREKPLIIDFYATWCGPCVMLSKELEQVSEALGDKVQILKIDCDENEGISSALQIQGLPTLIFVSMDPEKPALRTEGLLPAQSIIDIVNNEM